MSKKAEAAEFEVFVTCNQSIFHQQNHAPAKSLIVLGISRVTVLQAYPNQMARVINTAKTGSYQFLTYELPTKRKREVRGSSM